MNKTLVLGVILAVIVVASIAIIFEQKKSTVEISEVDLSGTISQREEITSLVDRAVAEIEAKGEAAFPKFTTPEWYYDDIYVFIWKMDGIRVVYPPDPSDVGTNQSGLKDGNGKPIGELFIQTAENGGGWVEYQWPKPGETVPSTKIAYIKPATYQNQSYLVGSGIYV